MFLAATLLNLDKESRSVLTPNEVCEAEKFILSLESSVLLEVPLQEVDTAPTSETIISDDPIDALLNEVHSQSVERIRLEKTTDSTTLREELSRFTETVDDTRSAF